MVAGGRGGVNTHARGSCAGFVEKLAKMNPGVWPISRIIHKISLSSSGALTNSWRPAFLLEHQVTVRIMHLVWIGD